ncbi:MAG: RluA family pseudouridine synthase, partial [Burkholderiales bacterium]
EKDPSRPGHMRIARPGRKALRALTLYEVVERFRGYSLLRVRPRTGRTHQIRVHLAHIKHPVVADPTYDAGRANSIKNPRHRAGIGKLDRPFLHAARLILAHPASGEKMEFTAPLPAELQSFLVSMRAS